MNQYSNETYQSKYRGRSPAARRGFTLTEMLIAIGLLIAIMFAVYRIFTTASEVVGIGQGVAAINQELAAIERQMRADLERLAHDGVFVIRCIAVPNNIHRATDPGAPLLDPSRPERAYIRSDQLLFFKGGMDSTQIHGGEMPFADPNFPPLMHLRAQSTMSRVYYGHGFQLPNAPAFDEEAGSPKDVNELFIVRPPVGYEYGSNTFLPGLEPWYAGTVQLVGANMQNLGDTFVPPIPATQWTLARQPVLLIDDGEVNYNDPIHDVFFRFFSAPHLMALGDSGQLNLLLNSRVDMATQQLNWLRADIDDFYDPDLSPSENWVLNQRWRLLGDYLYYPRAERSAPGMAAWDHATTSPTLAIGCSSFTIDWTYDRNAGRAVNVAGSEFLGLGLPHSPRTDGPQLWYGLDSALESIRANQLTSDPIRGVITLVRWLGEVGSVTYARTIMGTNIEGVNQSGLDPLDVVLRFRRPEWGPDINDILVYQATFGFNQDQPFFDEDLGVATSYKGEPHRDAVYTPFPSAIRVTVRLHDRNERLSEGRELQFVIDLPRRRRQFN